VRHTRWHSASGTVTRWFDDVLVPATVSLAPNRLEALEPWDLAELKPYDPAFLSGFKAQRYQVDLAQGFERVKQVAAGVIHGDRPYSFWKIALFVTAVVFVLLIIVSVLSLTES
jgi:hypothetical protein